MERMINYVLRQCGVHCYTDTFGRRTYVVDGTDETIDENMAMEMVMNYTSTHIAGMVIDEMELIKTL